MARFRRRDRRGGRRRRPGRRDAYRHPRLTDDADTAPGVDIYNLLKFQRSNQNTCINQRPLVKVGDVVRRATSSPTARRPTWANWPGQQRAGRVHAVERLQLRDSILISERIVKDDVFTSIHIEEFEVMARDTKLGRRKSPATSRTSARKPCATSTRRASSISAPK